LKLLKKFDPNDGVISMQLKRKMVILLGGLFMSTAALAGDPVAGEKKAMVCASCHGAKGISLSPLWPNLAGQKAAYTEKQLKAFRSGERNDPLMMPMAKPLTDEDIKNLAAYYESLK